jgi:hypothetical protein
MPGNQYRLVNPVIEGKFNTVFSGQSELDAGEKAWAGISKYFSNNVPKFAFTMENVSDGNLHHFLIKEDKNGDNVDYSISELKLKRSKKEEAALRGKLQQLRAQHGGKKEEDESSSSSSSSDMKNLNKMYSKLRYNTLSTAYTTPFVYWGYTPYIYDFESFYMPIFVQNMYPYVEVFTTTNWWGY